MRHESLNIRRALLVNPPSGNYRRDDRCQVKVEEQTVAVNFPPIELAYDAAVLRQNGVECRIGDYPALGQSWPEFERELREFKPDLLLVSATTGTIEGDLQAMRLARELCPDIVNVGRGEYLTVNCERILPHHPELDLVLLGEPEMTLFALTKGQPVTEVKGLAWCGAEAGEVRRTPERELLESLDSLPFPARDLLANERYRSPDTHQPITVVYANRGCPSKCIFCPAGTISNYRVRFRDPAKVVEEIRECVERHGVREFLFHGDTFTINKKWTLELCDRLIEAQLPVRWGCNSRVDTICAERAQRMRQAGCWVVAFGLETGSQEIMDKMKKQAKVDRAPQAVRICKEAGLCVHGFFVVGMPWDTRETIEQTYRFARSLQLDFFDFNIATPLPGTELYDIVQREGLMASELNTDVGYHKAAVRTFTLSADELSRWRKRALLKMSLNPGYIFRTLNRARREGTLSNYLQAGIKRLKNLLWA
ncbi:radical SAM protein [Candidatus Sumerlaeota bacterium]|nr:radical SAM protein [Candidatus Sumerlaeota bacterium]